MPTETRTLTDLDRDLTELVRRRAKARRQQDVDLILVLTAAINTALETRQALYAAPRGTGPALATNPASAASRG